MEAVETEDANGISPALRDVMFTPTAVLAANRSANKRGGEGYQVEMALTDLFFWCFFDDKADQWRETEKMIAEGYNALRQNSHLCGLCHLLATISFGRAAGTRTREWRVVY